MEKKSQNEEFPLGSIRWDEKKEKKKRKRGKRQNKKGKKSDREGKNKEKQGRERKKKKQKRERGVRSSTFSLRFMEIRPPVFVGVRGKVHLRDESFP